MHATRNNHTADARSATDHETDAAPTRVAPTLRDTNWSRTAPRGGADAGAREWAAFCSLARRGWDQLSEEDIASVDGSVSRLYRLISAKSGESEVTVMRRLDALRATSVGSTAAPLPSARWAEIQRLASETWDQLTDEDFARAEGSVGRLYGVIQARIGGTEAAIKARLDQLRATAAGSALPPVAHSERFEQLKAHAKQLWRNLTDEDFRVIDGSVDAIYQAIAARVGGSEAAVKARMDHTTPTNAGMVAPPILLGDSRHRGASASREAAPPPAPSEP